MGLRHPGPVTARSDAHERAYARALVHYQRGHGHTFEALVESYEREEELCPNGRPKWAQWFPANLPEKSGEERGDE